MSRPLLPSLLCVAALVGASVARAVVVSEFTWSGSGSNTNATTAGNWSGGSAPSFTGGSGSARLIFPDKQPGTVTFSANSDAYGLTVTGHYHFTGAINLNLYGGGLTYSTTNSNHLVFENSMAVYAAADQTWNIGSNGRVEFQNSATLAGSGKITKTGAGTLSLSSGNSSWTGGLQFNEGTIEVRAGTYGTGENESRSLGTGTVTIGSDTASRPTFRTVEGSSDADVRLANNFVLNGVFTAKNEETLRVLGTVTLNADTTIRLAGDSTYFQGTVSESGGARKLTLDANSALILKGSTGWTGGTEVTKGILIFGSSSESNLPASGTITVGTNGYVGISNQTNLGTFVTKVAPTSSGTIGFDSELDGTPDNFNQETTIDLSGFNSNIRLGSASAALLSSAVAITPYNNNYRFGGGGGWLQVGSQLTSGRTLTLDSPAELPLTVRFTNTGNAFSSVSVTNSAAVFASGALPSGATLTVGNGAYLGTEDTGFSANATALNSYFTRFGASTQGIIGFDMDQFALSPATRVVDLTGANIGSLTSSGYLGTASALYSDGERTGPGVRFTGTDIAANSDNIHRFTAYKTGVLEIAGTLAGNSMIIGHPSSLGAFGDRIREDYGIVMLTGNNANKLTGGTTLYGGRLVVGQASGDGTVGTDHTHALGEGALTVGTVSFTIEEEDGAETPSPMLSAAADNIIIANNVTVNASELNIGGDKDFTLSGVVSGTGKLFVGEESDSGFVLTLSGANTYSGGTSMQNSALLKANHNTALGTGKLLFEDAGTVEFGTTAPVINGLESYSSSAKVKLVNTASARLRIVQNSDTTYQGELRADSGSAGTYGVFVKEGTGTLRLDNVNIYGSGQGSNKEIIEVKAGTLVLASATFGDTSTQLKVNGGTLALDNNQSVSNAISVLAGKLAGHGTFSSLVSMPTATGITPGLNGAGTLTFSGGLSLTGGGTMDFGLGSISDRILVTGGTLTGPASGTVTLNLSKLDGFAAGTYTLINWSGASLTSLTAASFNIGNVPDGMLVSDFTLSVSGTTLQLYTAVPEPSTYALLALGLGFLGLNVWRRRRAS